ncbi:hypothetical protein [Arthrobacter sp. UKPF54-2]|uniref:hypothetical protein n=1 Tax=Arthrobacter sp. UKPF54-2 TaxID=2600159 RepID=UPI00164619BD|nr:hypothetical protein [Arthrobacter sp. UKPF54-2]
MTQGSNFSTLPTRRSSLASALVILTAFAAVLCWWIGLTGYFIVGGAASGGYGLAVFAAVPALATAATYFIARRTGRPASSSAAPTRLTTLPAHGRPDGNRRPARDALIVIGGFAAALFWWVGLTGYLAIGGVASGAAGVALFLAVPAALTIGTYLAGRRRSGPSP